MRDVAYAPQLSVTRGAAPDTSAGPKLELGDRGVNELEVVLPRALRGDPKRPPKRSVDRAGVRDDHDAFSGVPFYDPIAEVRYANGELAEGFTTIYTTMLGTPHHQIWSVLDRLERAGR